MTSTPVPERRFVVATTVFLRLVGVTFFFAFLSLATQVRGLIGAHGIEPAQSLVDALTRMGGARAYVLLPTVFRLDASNAALLAACVVGVIASVFIVFGVLQAPMLIVSWALYLSLANVGGDFLSYPFDSLLLETALLAIFLAPWTPWPGLWRTRSPPALPFWMLRVLFAVVLIGSGLAQLTSPLASWRHLTAVPLFLEAQPLPTWLGYFVFHLPGWFQHFLAAAALALELLAPLLLFLPRRIRRAGALGLLGFLILTAAISNQAFLALILLALVVLFLDDAMFPRRWRERVTTLAARPRWLVALGAPVAAAWLLLTGISLVGCFERHLDLPESLSRSIRWAHGWRAVNFYAVNAAVRSDRREVLLEGSDDKVTWKPYVFKYQPQDLQSRPAFVEPFQPRLDYQMWTAPFGACDRTMWFLPLLARLTQNRPEVTALLAKNPFPKHGPRYVRSTIYRYRFTDLETWWHTGRWWDRTEVAPFCPMLSAKSVRMQREAVWNQL